MIIWGGLTQTVAASQSVQHMESKQRRKTTSTGMGEREFGGLKVQEPIKVFMWDN